MESSAKVEIELAVQSETNQVGFDLAKTPHGEFIVMASLKAPLFEETSRAPIEVCLVIDRSGSMGDGKMDLVKQTMNFFLKQLKATDPIVIYDEEIETPLALTHMDMDGKNLAKGVISKIQPRGSTDLCGGLLCGIEVIKKRQRLPVTSVTSVLILTDGLANHGIKETSGIVAAMGADLPCSVHTFGFGSDHDANMLKAIAEKGTGSYFFLKGEDDIPDAFADCLGGLLSVVGQNIRLDLTLLNGCAMKKIHGKFKTTNNDNVWTVQLGDLQSEEERDILCSLILPSLEGPLDSHLLLQAKLSYFNVVTSKHCETSAVCQVARPANLFGVVSNHKVGVHKNRIDAADAMTEAKVFADKNQLAEARAVITKAIERLKSSPTASDELVRILISDLETTFDGLKDQTVYRAAGSHQLNATSAVHYGQRSAGKTASPSAYVTSAKASAKSAFH